MQNLDTADLVAPFEFVSAPPLRRQVVDSALNVPLKHRPMQGNETSPVGKDPWELLDVPVTTSGPMYLAIELVDTQQPNKRNAGAAAAGAAAADAQASAGAAAVAEVAGGVEGGASVADAVVLPRVAMRLKLRWNNTGNVEIVEGQADNTAEAPSIIPHVNTPGILLTQNNSLCLLHNRLCCDSVDGCICMRTRQCTQPAASVVTMSVHYILLQAVANRPLQPHASVLPPVVTFLQAAHSLSHTPRPTPHLFLQAASCKPLTPCLSPHLFLQAAPSPSHTRAACRTSLLLQRA